MSHKTKNTTPLVLALALCTMPLAARSQTAPQPPAPAASEVAAEPSAWDRLIGPGHWRLMASPYTIHWGADTENIHEPVYMIGLERQRVDGWTWGGTYFSNSFGQPSVYVYVGEKVTHFSRWDKLFMQWTAGVLYGYKDPYEDKVPYNVNGFSPGLTVSVGWQFTRQFSMQAIALGTAGLMFQLAIDLD